MSPQPKRQYFVYIMTSRSRTLYVGVTNNLVRRMYEHKQKLVPGFTRKYNLTWLAYYEETSDIASAIAREKQIKGWRRSKKVKLIEDMNPRWRDLSKEWFEDARSELWIPRCARNDRVGGSARRGCLVRDP